MIWRDERPRGRWLLLVLLTHLALAWLLLLATARTHSPAPIAEARPVVMVWLHEQRPERAAAGQPPPPAPRRRQPTAAPSPHQPGATTPTEPLGVPITLPPEPTTAPAGSPSPSPTASAPARLNLQLPRHWAASAPPAALTHHDPRLGSPMNRSERFAEQMGTDQNLVEEVTATGRRLRRGNTCVDLQPNRNGQLDPFNGSVRPPPSLASDCRENEVQQASRTRRPSP